MTASLIKNQLIKRFSQYRSYSRAVSATACARSGLSHRLALVHDDGRSIKKGNKITPFTIYYLQPVYLTVV